jgi:hypothetical protein
MRALIALIKETAKEAAEKAPVGPLINYVPPGSNIIINPIVDSNGANASGLKPTDTK